MKKLKDEKKEERDGGVERRGGIKKSCQGLVFMLLRGRHASVERVFRYQCLPFKKLRV